MTDRDPKVGDVIVVHGEKYRVVFVDEDFGLDYEDEGGTFAGSLYPHQFSDIVYTDSGEPEPEWKDYRVLPDLPTAPEPDNVNHPVHYTSHPSGVECITIVRHYNFNIGGAIKYLWRNGLKDADAQVEDLQKAIWLIEDEIKRLQETPSK